MLYRYGMLRNVTECYGMLRNVTDICNSFLTQAGASQAHGTKGKTHAQQIMMSVAMPKKGVNVHSANWSFDTRVLSQSAEFGHCTS